MSLARTAAMLGIVGIATLRAAPVLADVPAVPKNTDLQTQEQTEEKRKTLMADATTALTETHKALALLDAGRKKEALAALERASGKLDVILARDSSMKLAPTCTIGSGTMVSVTTCVFRAVCSTRLAASSLCWSISLTADLMVSGYVANGMLLTLITVSLAKSRSSRRASCERPKSIIPSACWRTRLTASIPPWMSYVVTETPAGANSSLGSLVRMISSLPDARSKAASAPWVLPSSSCLSAA